MKWLINISFLFLALNLMSQAGIHDVTIELRSEKDLSGAHVELFHENQQRVHELSSERRLKLSGLEDGEHTFVIYADRFASVTRSVLLTQDTAIVVELLPLNVRTEEVIITDRGTGLWLSRLKDVENMAIYASKKSELIRIDDIQANLSTNNARQLFSRVPGLNIWENDGAGLQLGIGARGLDPNRTAHFNTRQNGYDISADALGYPESYYTPPAEAIDKIEIVRGAASLQYGPQLGGLLNFQLKDGDVDSPFILQAGLTGGSNSYLDGHLSAEGKTGDLSYFAFAKYKRGDGWRENAGFDQTVAIANVHYGITDNFKIGIEATFMNYLAQQPGGLVDFEFEKDARSSIRDRNWFKVDWKLLNASLEYSFSETFKTELILFHLDARRQALGELGPIHRPDPGRERDLIDGAYNNWGAEWRWMKRYKMGELFQHLLIGGRLYQGFTHNRQGLGSDGSGPDFEYLDPNDLEYSDYDFPSRNAAVFIEHLFNITPKWSVTPGIRWEYIDTRGEGYFKNRIMSGGQVIFEETMEEERSRIRQIVLLGAGSSYRMNESLELYTNFSQNYRSINFSDLVVANPNLIIDRNLSDESGYNMDIGCRGTLSDGRWQFDISAFYLMYMDRIGLGEKIVEDGLTGPRAVAYRTNVGDAEVGGLEAYIKYSMDKIRLAGNDLTVAPFTNLSYIKSRYVSGPSSVIGNEVELVAPVMARLGVNGQYGNWDLGYLFSYIHEHFSDATNAIRVTDATRGVIPSYWVHDLTVGYRIGAFGFKASAHNLLDHRYFTRRATGYPGPGIIPAEGRTFFLTMTYRPE